jgi:hypothetical protein
LLDATTDLELESSKQCDRLDKLETAFNDINRERDELKRQQQELREEQELQEAKQREAEERAALQQEINGAQPLALDFKQLVKRVIAEKEPSTRDELAKECLAEFRQ